jgi:hypothetical protein
MEYEGDCGLKSPLLFPNLNPYNTYIEVNLNIILYTELSISHDLFFDCLPT